MLPAAISNSLTQKTVDIQHICNVIIAFCSTHAAQQIGIWEPKAFTDLQVPSFGDAHQETCNKPNRPNRLQLLLVLLVSFGDTERLK